MGSGLVGAMIHGRRRLQRADGPVVVSVSGGTAALVSRSVRKRLVTVLDRAAGSGSLVRGALERLQARRSAMLLAADRETAVVLAKRWHLDLARIRVVEEPWSIPAERLERELSRVRTRGGAWHGR